jgi:hypothetical protein
MNKAMIASPISEEMSSQNRLKELKSNIFKKEGMILNTFI